MRTPLRIGVHKNDKLSTLLGTIEYVTLENFGIAARLYLDPASDLRGGSDIRLIRMTELGDALNIPHPSIAEHSCENYFNDIVSYQETGVYVSDPTEIDRVSTVHSESSTSHCDAFISIYRAEDSSPQLQQAFGFITGELSIQEVLRVVNTTIDFYAFAQRWFEEHHQG